MARNVARIRERWPAVEIVLRADSGFARAGLMAWCEANGVDYVFRLARNERLVEHIAAALAGAERDACRKSEILTLRWSDVDLDASELRLADAKAGPRTVHLPPMAVELLEALPRREGSPWVFPGNDRDGRYSGGGLDHVWQTVRARAGLGDVRLHDLRHSLASRALALGETLPVIGKLLGHSDIETTTRYAHLAQDSIHETAERIAASIAADVL